MLDFPKLCATCGKPYSINHTCTTGAWTQKDFDLYDVSGEPSDPMVDLAERLKEAHRTLEMSRNWLMERTKTSDHAGIKTIDHIFDAMGHLEQAINRL